MKVYKAALFQFRREIYCREVPGYFTFNTKKSAMRHNEEYNDDFMKMAARLSLENIDAGGGPFGAVVVRDGEVISTGVNSVTADNDPTAHAEVNAIRSACRKLKSFRLEGCTVYSSCEPCPMCLSALYWAGIRRVYYGNTKEDADAIDFSDKFIYEEIERKPSDRSMPGIHVDNSDTIKAFEKWASTENKTPY